MYVPIDRTPMSHQLAVLYAFSCLADILSNLTLLGSGYHLQAQHTRAGEMCMNSDVICNSAGTGELYTDSCCLKDPCTVSAMSFCCFIASVPSFSTASLSVFCYSYMTHTRADKQGCSAISLTCKRHSWLLALVAMKVEEGPGGRGGLGCRENSHGKEVAVKT